MYKSRITGQDDWGLVGLVVSITGVEHKYCRNTRNTNFKSYVTTATVKKLNILVL